MNAGAEPARKYRSPAGLLEKLMAAVRPEFRAEDLVFNPRDPVFGGPPCAVDGCDRPHRVQGLCTAHWQRWRDSGRLLPLAEFTATAASWQNPGPGTEHIDLRRLPAGLRLEIQYVLQCRGDEQNAKLRPLKIRPLIAVLAAAGVSSLLEQPEEWWTDQDPGNGRGWRQFILDARCRVEALASGAGWDTEYPRDIWRLRNLGIEHREATVSFAGIPQPWLKDLAKRHIRWQLATGLSASTAGYGTRAVTRFAAWLSSLPEPPAGLAGVTRPLLESYLAVLQAELGGRDCHSRYVSELASFLKTVCRHGWDDTLPASAAIYPEDYPPRGARLPRGLAAHVMAQVEQPANLARQANPAYRLITLILIRCGLRISSAAGLAFDCMVTDADGAPYLRYYNTKMRREALVPVDDEILALIGEQKQRVLQRFPAGTPVLFPRRNRNLNGRRPLPSHTYRLALYRWLEDCDIRDEHGQTVHFTPHQWRHTLGTLLINRDVPQHVVQKILDHDSPLMTAHYARLSDKTMREHWERARKVNAQGQPVQISPGGPLGDAAWAKQQLSRATQALPNGYCQLPLVKTCPHANSCLTCPMFVTTAEFLPQHHAQRQATLQIISAAEAAGHARVAEMNRQVAGNLDKIIATLGDKGTDGKETVAGAS